MRWMLKKTNGMHVETGKGCYRDEVEMGFKNMGLETLGVFYIDYQVFSPLYMRCRQMAVAIFHRPNTSRPVMKVFKGSK